jgi:prolyl oligopeptidase
MIYPPSRKGEDKDDYGGITIADPYRWMEDLDSTEVAEWVAQQNAVTQAHLQSLPLRARLERRLTELWNYPRTSLPLIEGGRLFYSKNTGLQRQSPIYIRAGPSAEPILVLDPNALFPDGARALSQYAPSPDATLLAYAVADGGADWETIYVRDVTTGADLPDEIRWMRFSDLSWTKDANGFFYSRYPEPPKNKVLEAALSGQAIYYHRIGTRQSDDELIYERPDQPSWIVGGSVTEDGRYLLVTTHKGADNNNQLFVADLGDPLRPDVRARIRPLVESQDAEFAPIGNDGTRLYLRSDKDAPRRHVIAIDLEDPQPSAWKVVVPERAEVIESVALVGGRIVTQYLVDVQSRLRVFGLDGVEQPEIVLPALGTVSGMAGRCDEPGVWYLFSSPLAPGTVYRYDPGARISEAFEAATPPIDTSAFETRALFATSKDGTRVPLFVSARKDLTRNGDNPMMIYGYGGFSISVLPAYRPDVPAWLELGGVFVTVSLRGGAEYGEAWHKAGSLERKQNVFDDMIAAVEFLVKEGITSPSRLGIMGGSNGGLLVGAVMEQRPDLFAVAMPAVGVMDMLRYDKFTGGQLWATEYGSSSGLEEFAYLLRYSPLHNLRPGTCYPATLITTADHDDRVVPSHSFKFAAALQAAQGCERPVLIRVETQGSHGYRPTDKLIAEKADQWAFAGHHLRAQVLKSSSPPASN